MSPLVLEEPSGGFVRVVGRGVVGTDAESMVRLDAGPPQAALLEPAGGYWWIVPISPQAVRVNGRRVTERRALNDGDALAVHRAHYLVHHDGAPLPPLDLQEPPRDRRRFARRVVLFERDLLLAWAEDRRCFVEMQRALAMSASRLRERPEVERRVRWWRLPEVALPTSGRVVVERTYVPGAPLPLLLARVRQLAGGLDDGVRRELLRAAAEGMREGTTGLVGGAVAELDLLIPWEGEVLVGDASLEPALNDLEWRRPLVALADALGADLGWLGADLLDTCRRLEGAPAGAAADFAASILPEWRAHQLAWLDEAQMLVDALPPRP